MRIEKGHVAGAELNGQTTARDLGLGKMLSTKKDFIGRVMAARPALTDPERPTLVGLQAGRPGRRGCAPARIHPEGCRADGRERPGLCHLGRLLADARPLDRARPARARAASGIGEIVRAYDPVRGGDVLVEVRPPCFIDPEGERLRV